MFPGDFTRSNASARLTKRKGQPMIDDFNGLEMTYPNTYRVSIDLDPLDLFLPDLLSALAFSR